MADARAAAMDTLNTILVRYRHLVRLAWLALIVVLAACQQDGGGGGGGDGGGGDGGGDGDGLY